VKTIDANAGGDMMHLPKTHSSGDGDALPDLMNVILQALGWTRMKDCRGFILYV